MAIVRLYPIIQAQHLKKVNANDGEQEGAAPACKKQKVDEAAALASKKEDEEDEMESDAPNLAVGCSIGAQLASQDMGSFASGSNELGSMTIDLEALLCEGIDWMTVDMCGYLWLRASWVHYCVTMAVIL